MNTIIKSSIDERSYKVVTLENELTCVLISDKDTERSAAAMCVDVGSFEDPKEREGLAHFCEHMLFMGTQKYPNEAEYQEYITKNSGMTNAYTSTTKTNYMFQIANTALEGALDRFSQFFISPLFDESCTEREMKAVDSEFNLNLQKDYWREYQLLHSVAKKGHKYSQFMIGNLKTLQFPDTRDYLLAFYKKYYSSNVMKLVVYGQDTIETLEGWVKQYFSGIPNQKLTPPAYTELPFDESTMCKHIKIKSVQDEDYLTFIWYLDYLLPHYKQCPGNYISHLLGHEGQNSLLSLLIDEGLAYELSSGPENEMKLFSEFQVKIKLTKKGLQNPSLIALFVFKYIEMLKEKGNQEWIFQELRSVRNLQFAYLEKQKPFSYVSTLAQRLHEYPAEEILKAPYFMENYVPEVIQKFLDQFTLKNMMVLYSSKDFTGLASKEEYFGTEYTLHDLQTEQPEWIDVLLNGKMPPTRKRLDLPVQNIFIPKSMDLLPDQATQHPRKVFESNQSVLYYKKDDTFKVPKANIKLRLYCSDCSFGLSAKTDVIMRVWHQLLENHTRELNYLAEMAYIKSSINQVHNGIQISVSG